MIYKVERGKGKLIKLYTLAEVEDADGNKVYARKLLKEAKEKALRLGIETEKKSYESDIETAKEGIAQLEQIKLLLDELNAEVQ